MRFIGAVLVLFIGLFASGAEAACPLGYFRIGPITKVRTVLDQTLTAAGTLCIKIETHEERADVNATLSIEVQGLQPLVDAAVKRFVRSTVCKSRWSTGYELSNLKGVVASSWGNVQVKGSGHAAACLLNLISADVAMSLPVIVQVSKTQIVSFDVDRPTVQISFVPSVAEQALADAIYAAMKKALPSLKYDTKSMLHPLLRAFNPEIKKTRVDYQNGVATIDVIFASFITSKDATDLISKLFDQYF